MTTILRRPCWTPETQPNGAVRRIWLSFWCSTRFVWKKLDFFLSKSSWTPKTQPNDVLRRRLLEFLVFNSAYGGWWSLNSAYCIMTIINFLRSQKKVLSKHSQFQRISLHIPSGVLSFRGCCLETFLSDCRKYIMVMM